MPSSSEVSGRYSPKLVPEQNYNRAPRESVKVDVNELNEISSIDTSTSTSTIISAPASKSKKIWIIAGLTTLGLLCAGGGVGAYLALGQGQSSTSTGASSSSTTSSANNVSTTTAGSSSSNLTTLSTTTVNGSTNATTASTASTTTIAAGFSASGAVVAGTTAWYGYEEVTLSCTANLNNITITIYVQKTVNATYSGAFSTFWGGTMNQTYFDNGTQIIYTWTIISGQTIQSSGSPYRAQAQFSLYGTTQVTSADTFTVAARTVGGVTSSLSGHF